MILIFKQKENWIVGKGNENGEQLEKLNMDTMEILFTYPSKIHAIQHAKADFAGRDIFLKRKIGWKQVSKEILNIEDRDEYILKNNKNVKKHESYFALRSAMYTGFSAPASLKSLRISFTFAILSLLVSIFAFIINAGVGVSKNDYAGIITKNRMEFLIPAFLLLVWPIWTIFEFIFRYRIIRDVQNFMRNNKYTHASFGRGLRRLRTVESIIIIFILSVSFMWLGLVVKNDSGQFWKFDNIISIFIWTKILIIIIPKIVLAVRLLWISYEMAKWRANGDFVIAVSALYYLDKKGYASAKNIIGSYDISNSRNIDEAFKEQFTYKNREALVNYIIAYKMQFLKESDRVEIRRMAKEFKEDVARENEIYKEIYDDEGKLKWR